jgi:hypothetical protein
VHWEAPVGGSSSWGMKPCRSSFHNKARRVQYLGLNSCKALLLMLQACGVANRVFVAMFPS